MRAMLVGAAMGVALFTFSTMGNVTGDMILWIIATIDAWMSSGWCGTG